MSNVKSNSHPINYVDSSNRNWISKLLNEMTGKQRHKIGDACFRLITRIEGSRCVDSYKGYIAVPERETAIASRAIITIFLQDMEWDSSKPASFYSGTASADSIKND